MTINCPERDEFSRLVDGQLTEDRAKSVRKHATECSTCSKELATREQLVSGLNAQIPNLVSQDAASKIVASVTEDERRTASVRGYTFRIGWAAAVATAAAAVLLVFSLNDTAPNGELTARGGKTTTSLDRSVGVTLYRVDKTPRTVTDGATLRTNTPLTAAYRNIGKVPAYLLMFGLDASRTVHWVYPGYSDPKRPPTSVRLRAVTAERFFKESVVLESPAIGPMTIVSVFTQKPMSVAAIERMPKAELSIASLRTRWPNAAIEGIAVNLIAERDNIK